MCRALNERASLVMQVMYAVCMDLLNMSNANACDSGFHDRVLSVHQRGVGKRNELLRQAITIFNSLNGNICNALKDVNHL